MKQLTGIILAGGKSSRMGTDKAFIRFKGKMLIEYPITLLKPICNEILISANSEEYRCFGFDVVYDEFPGYGPVGGIFSSLSHSSNEWNFVTGCDTPNLSNQIITRLLAESEGYDCVVPEYGGKLEPLAALYNKKCMPKFAEGINEGQLSLRKVLHQLNCHYVDVADLTESNPVLFSNFNTPADIK
jgi:molybdopterin-guanine dinucleotide biosynthesis protein A